MRISTQDMINFCNTLQVKLKETHPDSSMELKQSGTGEFVVIIHSDDTLQGESECYTVDPVSREWIKTYGTF